MSHSNSYTNQISEDDGSSEYTENIGAFEQLAKNPWIKVLFLPLFFIFAILLESAPLIKVFSFGFTHWFHEIGHALFSWMSSRAALPIIGVAITNYDQSTFTYLCFLFLILFIGYSGIRFKAFYLTFIASLLFLAQCFYTFFSSFSFWEMSMIYGGIGGEFIISTAVISAFSHRLPKQTYWELLRFLVVPFSIFSFWQSFSRWYRISENEEFIPWGTMWGGENDSGGDMNRLHLQFSFTREDLVHLYMTTAWICLIFIIGNYLWQLMQAIQEIGKGRKK